MISLFPFILLSLSFLSVCPSDPDQFSREEESVALNDPDEGFSSGASNSSQPSGFRGNAVAGVAGQGSSCKKSRMSTEKHSDSRRRAHACPAAVSGSASCTTLDRRPAGCDAGSTRAAELSSGADARRYSKLSLQEQHLPETELLSPKQSRSPSFNMQIISQV